MNKFFQFIKKEPVLCVAALAAAVSCCFVPPDRAYRSYVDFRTLALLWALMAVVSGLRGAGAFDRFAYGLCAKVKTVRALGTVLVGLTFFSAMLITNDVALLTFVPFSMVVLGMAGQPQVLRRTVVLQTVAANLGSILTPVGNPQNLYLYSHYGLGTGAFFQITFPTWALSLLLVFLACRLLPGTELPAFSQSPPTWNARGILVCTSLFFVCLLTVVRVLSWPVMLGIVAAGLACFDRKRLLEADFFLLLTFVAFFIFSGNLARLESVDRLLRSLLQGREYLVAVLTSQVISNVPAALLLSGFTENARSLILGVDIGGLGTPIASLASLIGLKLYARTEQSRTGAFLLEFLIVNIVFLFILSAVSRYFTQGMT